MKRLIFLRTALVLMFAGIGAGPPSAQNGSSPATSTSGPQRDQLIEIKIRRARWNISLETLRTGPASPAGQQDVKVAIAPSEDDLVRKQLISVSCGGTPTKSVECGPEGGVLTCTIDGSPADVKVTIAIEFALSTGLPSVTKTIEKPIKGEGLLVLFQAFSDTTNMFVDRGMYGCRGDYLWADLNMVVKGKEKDQPQRQVLLSSVEGRLVSSPALFNVLAADDDPPLRLTISGRLQGYLPARLAVIEPKAMRTTPSLTPYWDPYRGHLILAPIP